MHAMRRLLAGLMALLLLATAAPGRAAAETNPLGDFAGFVTAVMNDWQVPGAAVGIVQGGQVIFAQGFGTTAIGTDAAATPETLFQIGSATKAFTALAFQSLVEEKRLDWDQPVRDYIPGFRVADPLVSERLTARDLATHRSGLLPVDLPFISNPDLDTTQIIQNMRHLEMAGDFRTSFDYNNLGYVILGQLVEQAAGHEWAEVVESRILQPLGMTASAFTVAEMQRAPSYAQGHRTQSGTTVVVPHLDAGAAGPAGGIVSNLTDMLKWTAFQLSGTPQIVSPRGLAETHSLQMARGGLRGYGLGWFVEAYHGRTYVYHGGSVPGGSSLVSLLPEDQIGVVVLTNSETPAVEIIAKQAIDRLLGLQPVDLNSLYLEAVQAHTPTQPQVRPSKPAPPSHELTAYTGAFANPLYGDLQVEENGEALQLRYYTITMPLTHTQYDQFTGPLGAYFTLNVPVRFETDMNGEISAVLVDMELNGHFITFARKPAEHLLDPAYLEKLTGTFAMMGQPVVIALDGTTLTMTLPGQPPYVLVAETGLRFHLKEVPAITVTFELDATGQQATKVVIVQAGYPFEAERVR